MANLVVRRRHRAGETLIPAGILCDFALVIQQGEAWIYAPENPRGPAGEPSGRLGPGDVFGDVCLVQPSVCPVSVIAATEVDADILRGEDFRTVVDRSLAEPIRSVLAAWRLRLAGLSDGSGGPKTADARYWEPITVDHRAAAESAVRPGTRLQVRLVPETEEARAALPDSQEGLVLRQLPVVIGRRSKASGAGVPGELFIALEDQRPYHLSRRHFLLRRSEGGIVFEDVGSRLGTRINGEKIGGHRGEKHEFLLAYGKNRVVLGGNDSRLIYSFIVEPHDAPGD